jgi:hypothetical protein
MLAMRTRALTSLVSLSLTACLTASLTACLSVDGSSPPRPDGHGTRSDGSTGDSTFVTNNNVDILFLIDNSPSMGPKQAALSQAIGSFVSALNTGGMSYHLGVVDSDLGALPPSGTFPSMASIGPQCGTLSGDNGVLQATPCSARTNAFSSPNLTSYCTSTACPTAITPQAMSFPDGTNATASFIASTGGAAPMTNVPGDQVAQAFSCMSFLGDVGCGVENQLEAMKRAVDGTTNPTANQYFLRPNALLALVILTDEDDCSVQDRTQNDPKTMDCTGIASPTSGCYNVDYRCYAEGTMCDQPLDTMGLKTGCKMTTGSYLYDVSQYTSFFDGLKPRGEVLVYGLISPPNGPVQIDYVDGTAATGTPALNRSLTNPACMGAAMDPITNMPIVGKPQVRLEQFIQHYRGSEYSVCDTTNYGTAMSSIAASILSHKGTTSIGDGPAGGIDASAGGG